MAGALGYEMVVSGLRLAFTSRMHDLFREYEPLAKNKEMDELMLNFESLPLYMVEQEYYNEPSIDEEEEEVVDGDIIE